jgi:hypothetical protein
MMLWVLPKFHWDVVFVTLPCQQNEVLAIYSSFIIPQSQPYFFTILVTIRIMDTPNPSTADGNLGGLLLRLLWSLAGISACILVLRLCTGALILHRIKLHDYLMIMAFVSAASVLQPPLSKAYFSNSFALSCKLHSLPLLFIGAWVDMQTFSMRITSSIQWSSFPCAKDGESPALVSDGYHSVYSFSNSSAHLKRESGSFTSSLELRRSLMPWQLSLYMCNVVVIQRHFGIPISEWNVGVHLFKKILAFSKVVSFQEVLGSSSC